MINDTGSDHTERKKPMTAGGDWIDELERKTREELENLVEEIRGWKAAWSGGESR